MAGLFDKQAKEYLEARPTYPSDWFSTLASLTPNHYLAWDVGAGNGQASIGLAEHYERVVATDISKQQLELAQRHPRVTYALTPSVLTDQDIYSVIGPEGSVDLITVAMAVHWFEVDIFYSQVKRLLRKPGGVIAVWGYRSPSVSAEVDAVFKDFLASTMPYWDRRCNYGFDGYSTLPFPFEPVLPGGGGGQGNPALKEMEKEVSLEGYLGVFRSWSAVITAREKGVELLSEDVLTAFRDAWRNTEPKHAKVRTCKFEGFILAGTTPL